MQVSPGLRPLVPPRSLRVFVADDHRVTLWGLQRLVESASPRMELVGIAGSRHELLNHPAVADADVLLLDLDLAGESALEALPELRRRSHAQVLVLTACDDATVHREAVLRGARGVLHKSAPADTVLRAIERVGAGEVWLRQDLLGELLDRLSTPPPAVPQDPLARLIESLTPRERQVIAAMVQHAGAKQLVVADALEMSEHTLRNHLTTIYGKLGVRGRLELHLFAVEHGIGEAGQ
ncbi:MAG TPA: response regulator transcription factor [Albitalea sp.]|nr:response regulator transcription factor [Albitalea sp.]